MAVLCRDNPPHSFLKRWSVPFDEESVYKLVAEKSNSSSAFAVDSNKKGSEDRSALPRFKNRRTPVPSHIDSSQVCQVLNPPKGIRDLMQRKGITPRNHFKDNKAAIAEQSAQNHALRQAVSNTEPPPCLPVKEPKPKVENQTMSKNKDNTIDFVARNVKEAAQVARRASKPERESYRQKENFGKIPAYLIRRKIELAQQIERRLQEEKTRQIPPGYVMMPEAEKEEVLKTLQENKGELEKKLSTLPLLCDTPSQIRAKSSMDQQLREIEDAIKRFSMPTVYIALNE